MIKTKTILLSVLLLFFGITTAHGTNPDSTPAPSPSPSPDPLVTVTQPNSYVAKKFYLFPLELPAYIMKGVTYPLLALTRYMEKNNLIQFTPRDWLIIPIVQAGGGDGFGGGFFFRHANIGKKGYQFSLDFTIWTDLDTRSGISFRSPPETYIGDRPAGWKFKFRVRDNGNARFYGVGADSQNSNESEYAILKFGAGGDLDYWILPQLRLSFPLAFFTAQTDNGKGNNNPSVNTLFPPEELTGFKQRATYAILGIEVLHDTRDNSSHPTRGGYRSFEFLRYQGVNTFKFDFNQFFIDIRQYFPLGPPRYAFVVRNAWQFQDATGSSGIPFYLLSQLDVDSPLRGFSRGRFRDTSYVLFNFEYRYPIWDFMNGNIFFDTGKVFNGLKNFNFNDWRYSVGGGFTFSLPNLFLFRIQAGFGGEGPKILFGLSQAI